MTEHWFKHILFHDWRTTKV